MAFQLTMGLYRESRDVVRVGQGVPLHPSISKKSYLIALIDFDKFLSFLVENRAKEEFFIYSLQLLGAKKESCTNQLKFPSMPLLGE